MLLPSGSHLKNCDAVISLTLQNWDELPISHASWTLVSAEKEIYCQIDTEDQFHSTEFKQFLLLDRKMNEICHSYKADENNLLRNYAYKTR